MALRIAARLASIEKDRNDYYAIAVFCDHNIEIIA